MRKKCYTIRFVNVGTPEQSATIIKRLVRNELQKVLDSYGANACNLDELLDNYIGVQKIDEGENNNG
ncbi:hypothetical protein D3C74_51220 [compost metagenome]